MKLLLTSYAAEVIEKAIPLLPKKPEKCRIICIPTAANAEDGDKTWLSDELDAFKKVGFTLTMLDLENTSPDALETLFADADIVYLTGGNTFYLLEKMRSSGFDKALEKFLKKGGLYIGSSASTIACCPDISYVACIDHPEKAHLSDTTGLHLIDFFIMVHMNQPDFANKARDMIEQMKKGNTPLICLNDNQALYIEDQIIKLV